MRNELASVHLIHRFWPLMLVVASAIATFGFACVTPFAAFAVAAAYVLPLPAAVLTVAGVWLANQAVGFLVLGYPWDGSTLLWGIAIGASASLATLTASVIMRGPGWHGALSLLAGFMLVFGVYEAGLYFVTFGLGGADSFTPAIVGQFALLNLVWGACLITLWELATRTIAGFRPNTGPSFRGQPVP